MRRILEAKRLQLRPRPYLTMRTPAQGCKMISLALHTRRPPPHEQDTQRQNRLRDSALWYPTIPPRNLCLNEEAFTPRAFYTAGFKPLFWCHFGGPGGKYLPHLTGVTVTSCVGILRIRFSFDTQFQPSIGPLVAASLVTRRRKSSTSRSMAGTGSVLM